MTSNITDKYIQRYLNNLTNQSQKTVDAYTKDLEMFNKYMDRENTAIITATLDDLQGYARYLKIEQGYLESTMNRRLQLVKYLYKYLHKTKVITENPSEYLELPKIPERLPESLTLREARKLISVVDKEKNNYLRIRDKAILLTFLNHGLRLSELAELELSNIKGSKLKFIGKGNKERSVIMTGDVITAIKDYLKVRPKIEDDVLFLSERKRQMSNGTIQKLVAKYLKLAKLEGNVHLLRHSAATLMLEQDIDPRSIQTILGHSDIKTTERYMKVTDKRKGAVAQRMNGLFTDNREEETI